MPVSQLYNIGLNTSLNDKISICRNNPAAIMQLLMLEIDNITDKDIANIDPTNPFIAALEAVATTSVALTGDHVKSLRSNYALLAEDNSDLYKHMSDSDYVNRFATYSSTDITFMFLKNDIRSKGVYSEDGGYYKVTIPRYTVVKVSNVKMMLLHPVDIKEYDSGIINITLDTSIESNIEPPKYNIIEYATQIDSTRETWIHFNVPMVQLDISSSETTIVSGSPLDISIKYEDLYYHTEVYMKNNETDNEWVRVKTTHSDIVYDKDDPTVRLTVSDDNILIVDVPSIYLYNSSISGTLRTDVYTTKGRVSIELPDFPMESFTKTVRRVDTTRDSNDYTSAFNSITMGIYGSKRLEGGRSSLSFKDIRSSIISHSTGRVDAPVTFDEVSSMVKEQDYDIYKALYGINSNYFIMTQRLDNTEYNVNTEITSTITRFTVTPEDLINNEYTSNKDNIITILGGSLFGINNDIVTLLSKDIIDSINAMSMGSRVAKVDELNAWYTPFYHVLDSSNDILDHRVYNLDTPSMSMLSFINSNTNTGVEVNTGTYTITKKSYGYDINVSTISRNGYNELESSTQYAQIVLTIHGIRYYIPGVRSSSTTTDGELIFDFTLETDHIINSNNDILITNLLDSNNVQSSIPVPLDTTISIFYISSSANIPHVYTDMDREISINDIPVNSIVLTKENIDIHLGTHLPYMFSEAHMSYKELIYKRYEYDSIAVYPNNVYQTNPTNGSIFFIDPDTCEVTKNLLYRRGERKSDGSGGFIYEHREGDIVLDKDRNPIIDKEKSIQYDLGMVLLEGEFIFATGDNYTSYVNDIASTIEHRCTHDAVRFNGNLLSNTSLYYGSHKTHGMASTDNGYVNARAPINAVFYIRSGLNINNDIIASIKEITTNIIMEMFDSSYIAFDTLRTHIKEQLGDIVQSITITGIGNVNDTGVINIDNDIERLGIKKILYIDSDGTLSVKADINYIIKYV